MSTSATSQTARAYFEAWTNAKGPDALRPLMHENFAFDAGFHKMEGREPFLAAAGWPEQATTTMLAEAYDGEHAFQLYEAATSGGTVKIVEHMIVRDGVIVSSEIVVDQQAFGAMMGG